MAKIKMLDNQHVSPYVHDVDGTVEFWNNDVVYWRNEQKEIMVVFSVLSQHTVYKIWKRLGSCV